MSVIVPGKNDLESYCIENKKEYLLDEWDYSKNYPLTPKDVAHAGSRKAWWICPKGHSFESFVSNRTRRGDQCPYCSNKTVLAGYNDLETFCRSNGKEILLAEWDEEKNLPYTPRTVLYGSSQWCWWICSRGHSYKSIVRNRTANGFQCPYCSSQQVLPGFNDLQTRRPEVLRYWDYEKNNEFLPSQVMAFSNKPAFWKCPDCNYEWKAAINNPKSCPRCTDNYKVSESEQILYYYLLKHFPDTELTYHAAWLGRREIDVYIPSIQVAIEYDGEYWHKSTQHRDLKKSDLIKEHGDLLIRIREEQLEEINDGSYHIIVPSKKYTFDRLDEPLREVFRVINQERALAVCPDIAVLRDWKEILSTAQTNKKEKSVAALFPDLALTWNYEKNNGLKPESFLPGSNKKVWWKCPDCGYEWEEIIVNRTKRQTPCSQCNSDNTRRLIPGVNDLASKYPLIAEEWDYQKNGVLKPSDFTYGADAKVWWKCSKCGKEWQSTIANRSTGFGCPSCGRKKAAESLRNHLLRKGENDLQTVNPDLSLQWDYEKNECTPDEIAAYSNKTVWWKCSVCGNSWRATVSSRINTSNCPFCINRRFKSGFNDVFSAAPQLEAEWDYAKNEGTNPHQIICSSCKTAWWICSKCGHSWNAQIRRRCEGHGCPECGRKQGLKTRTDNKLRKGNTLADKYPEVAAEWHPTKNGDLFPEMVTSRNGRKVWWLGKCGHEWQATVSHRTNGTGCPFCADIENGQARRQKVINLDTGEIFDSAITAAKMYNVGPDAIRACVRGDTKRAGNPKSRWGIYKD